MRGSLEERIDAIDPRQALGEYARHVPTALAAFPPPNRMRDWDEFCQLLVAFWKRCRNLMAGVPDDGDYASMRAWLACESILTQALGCYGAKDTFDRIQAGFGHELHEALIEIACTMAENFAMSDLETKTSIFLCDLPFEDTLRAPGVYLERYGQLLPFELTRGRIARIHSLFHETLKEHPRLIVRLPRQRL